MANIGTFMVIVPRDERKTPSWIEVEKDDKPHTWKPVPKEKSMFGDEVHYRREPQMSSRLCHTDGKHVSTRIIKRARDE